ncbi:MAG: hypothetical protein ACD_63C00091G0008 [uncultured bacterium]|nr:MAG: hypothetical protein ACD_63C00091G0008 [uncultured bacterium]
MHKRKNFIAVKANQGFVCENCGKKIQPHKGGSFRNHCPYCLFSKHVDKGVPGDRKSECKGLMEPRGIVLSYKGYVLVHHCLECGKVSNNKTAPDDSFDALIELSHFSAI